MVDQHPGVAVYNPYVAPQYGPAVDPRLRGVVTPWHRKQSVRIVSAVLICAFISLCAIAMLLLLGNSFGIGVLTVAILAAFVPVPILVFALLWLDRYEPEPWHYLMFTFAWGAFVATLAALIINTTGSALVKDLTGQDATTTTAIFIAPPTEETAKAVPLFLMLFLVLIGRRVIHGVIDGIVYAGMAAIGFAFTENVLYFGGAYVEAADKGGGSDGLVALLTTFVMRAVMSPFAHPLFTSMTGIGVGLAAVTKSRAVRVLAPIGGLLLAILLHGTWNALATRQNLLLLGVGYLLIMIPLFIGLIVLAVWLRNKESRLVDTMLPVYVQHGWLTATDLTSLSTIASRRTARSTAHSYGGGYAAKAMQEFQLAAIKLALLRQSLVRGWASEDYGNQERELLSILVSRRQYVATAAARWTANHGRQYWGWAGYQGLHAPYADSGHWPRQGGPYNSRHGGVR
ncbi:MAG TPA: PrsW family intramembrane metalloprotease [Mycobacteriales bacterium]|jgi:RsiW-degrading membrane proteinase PrsW (M82 family)|nr:PrsW family intramembrane metalloprotease [Mycobacteriales bacterium]